MKKSIKVYGVAAIAILYTTTLIAVAVPKAQKAMEPKPIYVPVVEVVSEPVIIEEPKQVEEVKQYIEMEVEITAYCREPHHHICNNGNASSTATGTVPTPGRTIAVDPNVIPYGTEVEIDGHIYIAEDTGGAIKGNKIDILYETHQEALNWGRQTRTVKVYQVY